MAEARESLVRMSFRFFLRGLCWVAGAFIAFLLVMILFKSLVGNDELTQTNSITILPNADGVRKSLGSTGPVVLQVNIHGVIGLDGLTTSKIRTLLVESREDELKDRVKALLLSIRSPGGSAIDSEGIYHAIKDYKARYDVPVIAYVDGIAASGGMMIAAAADRIVASDVSLVGSVGVVTSPFFNVNDAMEKIGVEALTIFAGKDKDDLNPFRPWKADEGESIHAIVLAYYNAFLDIVTSNRPKLSREKLVEDYGAKVFPAKEAATLGFIDEAGYGPSQALQLTLNEAEISDDDNYRVIEMGAKPWMSELLNSKSPWLTGKIQHEINLSSDPAAKLTGQILYLYRQ